MTNEHVQVRRMVLIAISLLLGVTIAVAEVRNQRPVNPTGYLVGTVLDTNNAAVAGATVMVEGGGAKHTIATGEDGTFNIQLAAGIYKISVHKRGFCPARRAAFRLSSSTTLTLNLRLIVCPIVHSLILEGGQYKGETARYQAPFKEDEFPINSSSGPLNLFIQYGSQAGSGDSIQYKGFTLSDGKWAAVAVTYDFLTIYADNVRLDMKSLHLEATGNVVLERGVEKVKSKQLEVDLKGGEPKVKLADHK